MPRLLVADNSPFYRDLLTEGLGARGHQVFTVSDGMQALEWLATRAADAVILDLVMPRVSGARACRQIKSDLRLKATPVIILSGLREEEIDDPEGIGADAYVAKRQAEPMLDNLEETLRELLAGDLSASMRGFEGMHRREVVSELLEERRSRDSLLHALNEGFVRLAEGHRVIEANPAALRMLDLSEAQVVNRSIAEILGCEAAQIEKIMDGRGGGEVRLEVGGRILAARSRRPGGRDGLAEDRYLLLVDLTDQVRAEERRLQLEDLVQSSEKMSALGEVVACVAHELNNPLTGILGYSELILRLAPDERTRTRAARLHHEAGRCRRVVENLLCFARRRHAFRRPHAINAVVAKVLADQAVAASGAGIEVVRELAEGLPVTLFDAGQIEQVILNVLANAFDALRAVPEGRRRIVVRTLFDGGRIAVEIEDSGPGLPEAMRKRIFEPFVPSRRAEGGAGLGLAVSHGIIGEHGGRIEARSTNPGTCVRFDLPVEAGKAVPESSGIAASVLPDRRPVLVVDDESVLLDLAEDVLTDVGFAVDRAVTGTQALEKLGACAYEAIVIDMRLPDMDGEQLFETIQARRPEAAPRVIFTTGNLDDPEVARFLMEVGRPLLRKPFPLEELAAAIRSVAGERPAAPAAR